MTHSTNRTPRKKRNGFYTGINVQEDDFLLADLQVIPDDTGLTITPLNHLQDEEDAIDRLLVNTGFESSGKRDRFVPDDIGLTAHEVPEQHQADAFVVEPVDAHKPEIAAANPEPVFQVDTFISSYLAKQPEHARTHIIEPEPEIAPEIIAEPVNVIDIKTEQPLLQETFFEPEEPVSKPIEIIPEIAPEHPSNLHIDAIIPELETREPISEEPPADNSAAAINAAISALNQYKAEQQDINNQYKKRSRHYQDKAKTATVICYIALVIAILSLMSTVAISVLVFDMKGDVSKLTTLIEVLREDMETPVEKREAQ